MEESCSDCFVPSLDALGLMLKGLLKLSFNVIWVDLLLRAVMLVFGSLLLGDGGGGSGCSDKSLLAFQLEGKDLNASILRAESGRRVVSLSPWQSACILDPSFRWGAYSLSCVWHPLVKRLFQKLGRQTSHRVGESLSSQASFDSCLPLPSSPSGLEVPGTPSLVPV